MILKVEGPYAYASFRIAVSVGTDPSEPVMVWDGSPMVSPMVTPAGCKSNPCFDLSHPCRGVIRAEKNPLNQSCPQDDFKKPDLQKCFKNIC